MAKRNHTRKRGPTPRRTEHAEPPEPGWRRHWFPIALVVLGIGAVVLAGIVFVREDESDESGSLRDLVAQVEPGPVHVHGLGVNPSDGALYIATHTGLWRVGTGERKANRVGESRQDTMGFTVVGADRFLGSGHPDNAEQPPLLGLIESSDAGRSWKGISLSGEADFHVLRAYGDFIYGFDAGNNRLLESRDGGRTWDQRAIPEPVFDLVAAPRRPRRLLAAGAQGLWASGSGGDWTLRSTVTGLLAWPATNRLYAVDGLGRVAVSRDSGTHWRALSRIGGQPAAFLAQSSRELYVALHDGTIKGSQDGGRTWTTRSSP